MTPKNMAVIFFSPTGSTRKIAYTISKETNIEDINYIDLTNPKIRETGISVEAEIIIFGFPVYEEYIPHFIYEYLSLCTFNCQKCLIFSVYGNIGFGLSLKQMHKLLSEKGLSIILAAAFVAEHSFSNKNIGLAVGRPTSEDLKVAKSLAQEFIKRITLEENALDLNKIPGKLPFMARILPKNSAKYFTQTPVINKNCVGCKKCINLCPRGAINESYEIEENKCIRCFACVKKCKFDAREINYKISFLVKNVLKNSSKAYKKIIHI